MQPIRLFHAPGSRSGRTKKLLDLLQLDYETTIVELGNVDDRRRLEEVSPFGKVPVLVHGDRVILESAAQAMYLSELVPDSGLAPKTNDPRRALYYELFVLAPSELEARVIAARQAPNDDNAQAELDRTLELYRSRFAGPFFLGDTFYSIDVFIHWGLRFIAVDRIEQYPELAVYCRMMDSLVSWEGY